MPNILPREHLRSIHRTNERHEGRDRFVCLDRNERDTPFTETVLRQMLADLNSRDLTAYPDAGAFVSKLSTQIGFSEDWICETAGSDAAVRRLMMAYLKPGRTVVFGNPSYAMYDIYTRIFEGVPKRIDYRADRSLDLPAFLAAIVPGVSIAIIANPNQPTGTALPPAALEQVVARAAQVEAVCVVDEAYHAFYGETLLPLVARHSNLIVTRTMSKCPGVAGLRVGYAVGAPHLMKGLTAVRGGSEVSGVSLKLGCYLLDHPEIAEEFRAAVGAGRKLVVDGARRLGFEVPPCVTNFQLIRCPPGIAADQVTRGLADRGYLVKSGFDHVSLRDCIRVTLNGPEIMGPFMEALAAVIADKGAAGREATARSRA